MGMPVKVSVVVSTYNSGPYVEPCIASILGQSLPADEYEAIFVDDGSTDGTPDRLDRLAEEHANVRVIHLANSGGPGRPRNIGMDAAVGEFIQFVDHDDYLGTEALERMYAYGVANGADVIVGKMAGKGRAVPRELFRVNRPNATVDSAPLIESLTPHKMFRRSFLVDTGIRSPEGRRRLEDHVFVTEAYLRAATVSVIGDYICYYHLRRDDKVHFSTQPFEPVGYFTNLREALDLVEQHTDPGPLRDKLYRRWLRVEMIERLRGRRWVNWPADERPSMFREIHKVASERFGPGVAAGLEPIQRLVAALIMADRYDDVLALAEWEAGVSATVALSEANWGGGALHLRYRSELQDATGPMAFARVGDAVWISPPVTDPGADLATRPKRAKADLVVRHRKTAAEYFLPTSSTSAYEGPDERLRFVLTTEATIDPRIAAGGRPLSKGIWDLYVRISAHGWMVETRLGGIRGPEVPAEISATAYGEPVMVTQPYWTDPQGYLALDVAPLPKRLASNIGQASPDRAAWAQRQLVAALPIHVPAPQPMIVRCAYAGTTREVAGRLGVDGLLRADLPADLDPAGRCRVEVCFPRYDGGPDPRLIRLSSRASDPARNSTARRIFRALKRKMIKF
jgi:poly(ribitol-phosphate) beta-N-acetylglucosaminyltransferase